MKKQLSRGIVLAVLLTGSLTTACDRLIQPRPDTTLPDTTAVRDAYANQGVNAEFRFSGNVLEMVVQQPPDQLRRGGPLWARVGPYIYLFSPGTRELFENYQGIAGVRVITMSGDEEVARALLVRDALNEYSWPRARSLLAEALDQGTQRPSTMDRLRQFGEQNTTYRYNPRYVPER
ncbi:MAG TPA: hypothetical protein VK929_12840 [Longimicrobiales bacterium]|nr:hypothetical protein [Longimicrobiales bacterium]